MKKIFLQLAFVLVSISAWSQYFQDFENVAVGNMSTSAATDPYQIDLNSGCNAADGWRISASTSTAYGVCTACTGNRAVIDYGSNTCFQNSTMVAGPFSVAINDVTISFDYSYKEYSGNTDTLSVFLYNQTSGLIEKVFLTITANVTDGLFTGTYNDLNLGDTYYILANYVGNNDYGCQMDNISVQVNCSSPTVSATNLTFTNITSSSMTLNWTRGNGNNGVVIVASMGSSPNLSPVSGISYSASSTFGAGDVLGNGFIVYSGTGTTFNLSGLTANQTYHFKIYELNSAGPCYISSPLSGSQVAFDPVTNDDPCSAISLTTPINDCDFKSYNNFFATNSSIANPACGTADEDVWFKCTMPAVGNLIISTKSDSIKDIGVALYSGSCGSLTYVDCDLPTTGAGSVTILNGAVAGGTEIYIRVWEKGNDVQGPFGICAFNSQKPPCAPGNPEPDDVCANANQICNLDGYCGTTQGYNNGTQPYTKDDPVMSGGPGTGFSIENNGWLKFTASAVDVSLIVWVYNCSSDKGIQIALFEGDCSGFTLVQKNDGFGSTTATGNNIETTFSMANLTIGQDYYLMIDGYAGDLCDYTVQAIYGILTLNVGSDTTVCSTDPTFTRTATSADAVMTFDWYDDVLKTNPSFYTGDTYTFDPSVLGPGTHNILVEGNPTAACPNPSYDTLTIVVNNCSCNVTSSFTYNTACKGSATTFTNNSTSDASTTTYSWDFGDGTTSTAQTPSHTYVNAGTYNVTLVVTGDAGLCSATSTETVTVNELPDLTSFDLTNSVICSGSSVELVFTGLTQQNNWTIDVNGQNIVANTNNFNDNLTFTNVTANTTYTINSITDGNGCVNNNVSDNTASVSINPALGISIVSSDCNFANTQYTVVFEVTGGTGNYVVTPNNGTSSTPLGVFTYTSPLINQGTAYSYSVTDEYACSNPSIGATVNCGCSVVSSFTASTVCVGTNTTFVNNSTSTANVTAYSWDFGDGNTSTSTNPTHNYSSPGIYTVTLTVIGDNGVCTDVSSQAVIVKGLILAGTIGNDQEICNPNTPVDLSSTLAATSVDGTINYTWQSSVGCTGTWVSTGVTTANYSFPSDLTTTTCYRRSVTDGCQILNSNVVTITVNSISPGSIGSDQTIPSGGDPTIFTNNSSATTASTSSITYQWQSSVGCTGVWVDILGANTSTYDPPAGITSQTCYRRKASDDCTTSYSNIVTITIGAFSPGTIFTSEDSLCSGVDPAIINNVVAATAGAGVITYQWQQSTDNSNWSDIIGETNLNYDPGILSQSTYFRRKATNAPNVEYSNTVFIVINTIPLSAGTIGTDQSINIGDDPNSFSEIVSSSGWGVKHYQWEYSVGCTGVWRDLKDNSNNLITSKLSDITDTIKQTTCFRRRIIDNCGNAQGDSIYSNTVQITVNTDILNPGTISSSQIVCAGDLPNSLIGTNASGYGTLYYQWYKQNNCSGAWNIIVGANAVNYTFTTGLFSNACYKRVVSDDYGTKESNVITITVNSIPTANSLNPAICENVPGFGQRNNYDLTIHNNSIGTGVISWYTDNIYTNQVLSETDTTVLNNDVYYIQVTENGCTANSTVTFNVSNTLVVSNQNKQICEDAVSSGQSNYDLTSLNGAIGSGTITWYQDAGLSTGLPNPNNALITSPSSVYYAKMVQGECVASASATIIINAMPVPNDYTLNICPNDLSNGLDLTSYNNIIDGGLGLVSSWNTSSMSLIASPTNVIANNNDQFVAILDNGSCQSNATLTVNELLSPTAANATKTYCADEITSGVDLTTLKSLISTGGDPLNLWYNDALLSSSILITTINPTDGQVVYGLVDNGSCQQIGSITFDINQLPTANVISDIICSDVASVGVDLNNYNSLIDGSTGALVDSWYLSDGVTQVSAPVTFNSSTLYKAKVNDGLCENIGEITLNYHVLPDAVDVSKTICAGQIVDLTLIENEIDDNNGTFDTWYSDFTLLNSISTSQTPINGDIFYGKVNDGVCSNIGSVTYTVNPIPNSNDINRSICSSDASNGISLVALNSLIDGATGSLVQNWYTDITLLNTVTNALNVNPINNTVYYAKVEQNNCSSIGTVTYSVTNNPTYTDLNVNVCIDVAQSGYELTNLNSSVDVNGGGANVSGWYTDYSLTNVVNPTLITFSTNKTYYVKIQVGSCVSVATVTLNVLSLPAIINQNLSLCEDAPGSGQVAGYDLTAENVNINNGAGLTFNWFTDNTLTTPVADESNHTIVNGDNYWVSVNNGSCSNIAVVNCMVGNPLIITDQNINLCEDIYLSGVTDTSLSKFEIIIGGGGQNKTYTWYSDPALTNLVGNLDVTLNNNDAYYLKVEEGICLNSAKATFIINSLPDSFIVNETVCADIALSGIDLTQYESGFGIGVTEDGWFNNSNLTNPVVGVNSVIPTDGKQYFVRMTDGMCSFYSTVNFNVLSLPSVNNISGVQYCETTKGSSTALIDLTSHNSDVDNSGVATVTWYSDITLLNMLPSPSSTTVSNSNYYYAKVDDGNCQSTASIQFLIKGLPSVNNQTKTMCSAASSNFDLTKLNNLLDNNSGSFVQNWYLDNLTTNLVPSTIVTPINNQKYYALINDGVCTNVAEATFVINNTPTVNSTVANICESEAVSGVSLNIFSATIDNNTNYLSNWYYDSNCTMIVSNPANIYPQNNSSFYGLVVDGSCSDTGAVTFTVVPSPLVSNQIKKICLVDAQTGIDLSIFESTAMGASNQLFVDWYKDQALTVVVPDKSNEIVTNGSRYYGKIRTNDIMGCENTSNLDISIIDMNISEYNHSNVLCYGESNGSTAILVSNGTPNYQYSIDGGANYQLKNTFNSLSAGNYNVLVKDLNGCEESIAININEPNEMVWNSSGFVLTNEKCNQNDGSILVSLNGGSPAYLFSKDNYMTAQSGGLFSSLNEGSYTISVKDKNDCRIDTSSLILTNSAPVFQPIIYNERCKESNGAIKIEAQGGSGVGTYTYKWNVYGSSSDSVGNLSAYQSPFTLIARDANCTVSMSIPLINLGFVQADFDLYPEEGTDIISPELTYISNSENVADLLWDFGDGNHSIDSMGYNLYSKPGNYPVTLIVWDEFNCSDTLTQYFNVDDVFKIFVPNTIVPESDNVENRTFGPITSFESQDDYSFIIYNRWGQKVYSSNTLSEKWNGRYNNSGSIVPVGVYVYKIFIKSEDGTKLVKEGFVTVL